MNTPPNPNALSFKQHKMVNEAAIQLALADLQSQEHLNYTTIAKRHNISRITLMRRHKRQTVSQQEAHSIYQKRLTNAQEEVLLQHINNLSDRGMPPTPQIVTNIVEEMVKQPIGQHWVYRFCQRYQDQIKSIYLRAIDQTRQIADNSPYFEHFYNTVGSLPLFFLIYTYLLIVKGED